VVLFIINDSLRVKLFLEMSQTHVDNLISIISNLQTQLFATNEQLQNERDSKRTLDGICRGGVNMFHVQFLEFQFTEDEFRVSLLFVQNAVSQIVILPIYLNKN